MKKLILLITALAACVLLAVPVCAATEPDEEETHRSEPIASAGVSFCCTYSV